MAPRLQLHNIFVGLFPDEEDHVYFQAPVNAQMEYPCILYQRDYAITRFAENKPYFHAKRYLVTVIDADPDSELPDKVASLPACRFDRHYRADKLNHDVFRLFF